MQSTRNMHEIVWNSESLDYNEFSNILSRDVKGEYFEKWTENCETLGNLRDKEVYRLKDYGCPRYREHAEANDEMWKCSSYATRHKNTLKCAERKAKVFGNWTLQHFIL